MVQLFFPSLEVKRNISFTARNRGKMVSMLVFFSDHLSSNPNEVYSFYFLKLFEKKENVSIIRGISHFVLESKCIGKPFNYLEATKLFESKFCIFKYCSEK